MVRQASQPTSAVSTSEGAHLVLYDGVCGLCSRLVHFLLVYDRRRVFTFASLQSTNGQAMVVRSGNPSDLTTLYVFADYRTPAMQVFTKSDAALFVASQLGWPWRAICAVRVLPKALLDRMYDAVARTRYRVFGRYEQCLMPLPEFSSRFVDETEESSPEVTRRVSATDG